MDPTQPTVIRLTVDGLVPPKKNLHTIHKDPHTGRMFVAPNHDWSEFIARVTMPLTNSWRKQIGFADEWEHVKCGLYIQVVIVPHNKRRRDADNVLSGVFDLIKGTGLVADDSQFRHVRCDFGELDREFPHVDIAIVCADHAPNLVPSMHTL